MEEFLRISDTAINSKTKYQENLDSEFVEFFLEMKKRVQDAGSDIHYRGEGRGSYVPPTEIIVALGSAGVFSALYQTISSYLTRNQDKELTLEKGDTKITIKGHTLPEEMKLLELFAPELLPPELKKKRRKHQ